MDCLETIKDVDLLKVALLSISKLLELDYHATSDNSYSVIQFFSEIDGFDELQTNSRLCGHPNTEVFNIIQQILSF